MLRLFIAFVVTLIVQSSLAAEPRHAEFGIDRRVPWTTSRITGSPSPPAPYTVERVFPSLTFETPAELVAVPGTNRLAMIELKGTITTFENRPADDQLTRAPFADVSKIAPGFTRLYGLAFHPQFKQNRYCYLSYVLKSGDPAGSRVSRFKVTDTDPPQVDLASEQIVITWLGGGHNGAHLQFGPDGCLYISTGDGGSSFPPDGLNSGQDISELLASILRIDVDHADGNRPYRIPKDNPFVAHAGARGEVWAYGLRNPWKMCFDPKDGSLWTGDVGWEMWEMIYRVERGGNYGWSLMEGRQPVHRERVRGPTPILPPTVEHDHTESRSITGGYFWGSSRLPELNDAYVYGDYVTGKMWALRHEAGKVTWRSELVDTPLQIVTFGRDHQGEVYIVDYAGAIFRLMANPRRAANSSFPKKLSETGLFAATAEHALAPGVISYRVNVEPWADGTTAERFVALPGESKLGTYKKTDVQIGYIAGEWEFPSDGVLGKTVSMAFGPDNTNKRRIETQLLHYDVDTWKAYNYIWNDEQTDAVLADDAPSDRTLSIVDPSATGGKRQQTWHHASRVECIICHTTRAGSIHGFRLPQLDRDQTYGDRVANQLATLDHIGLFKEPILKERTAWTPPQGSKSTTVDSQSTLEHSARAYLHVNCAHCHRRGGGGSAAFDVQITNAMNKTGLLGARPTQGTFGLQAAQLVAPGDPYRSVLYYRMAKLGHGRMPQFGSQVVDETGLSIVHQWISSLKPDKDSQTPASVELLRADETKRLAILRGSSAGDQGSVLDVVDRLLSTPSGALRLATELQGMELASALRSTVVSRGVAHSDPAIRDLFERFIPEEQRIRRLGSAVKADDLLKLRGDAARGRALFFQAAGVQCRNCHRIGQEGRAVGPDLNEIGKKLDRVKLLESLLEPSKTIDPKFVSYVAETSDGRVLIGVLVERTAEGVTLRDAQGREQRIESADLEQFVPQQQSLMPELLLRDLTAEQAADLLEFLTTLK